MSDDGLGMPAPKRVGPADVTPLILGDVRYEAIHWGKERGLGQNGGIIAAFDNATDAELWTLKVYEIDYEPGLEEDVQDIFITTLRRGATPGSIEVMDENGRRFVVDTSTRTVLAD